MEKLRIAIPGTRGIPNRYGGFEQLAEYLSAGLAEKGHIVTVYNSHNHPFKENKWKKVNIVHRFDPEYLIGTAGQFLYDLNCIRHAATQQYDVILFPGYTSSSVWGWLYPNRSVIISHMDGLEWKRKKYPAAVKTFLKYAEKLAIKYGHFYIADSSVVQSYLHERYNVTASYICYGAEIYDNQNTEVLKEFGLSPGGYYMLMARMEPENNIEMLLEAFQQVITTNKILVLGKTDNKFGKKMLGKFSGDPRIIFAGPLYQPEKIHSLKFYCSIYFHGHSVGGTNPSLLEAMASRALIAAHDNPFNREVLNENGFYFTSTDDIKKILNAKIGNETRDQMIKNNFQKIKDHFTWHQVIDQYENFILSCNNRYRS